MTIRPVRVADPTVRRISTDLNQIRVNVQAGRR